VKHWILVMMAIATIAGCQSQQKPAARGVSPAVLDVTAPPSYQPSAYTAPAYVPPPGTPAPTPPNTAEVTAAAAKAAPAPTTAAASDRSKYTIKKGDTLYHIAKDRYGDGKQWQKIVAANPGVSPTSLRVGQTLVMP